MIINSDLFHQSNDAKKPAVGLKEFKRMHRSEPKLLVSLHRLPLKNNPPTVRLREKYVVVCTR
jgi:hypothetical protein